MELTDKEKTEGNKAPRVLVTGASSGIGKATAELFARAGYVVYGVSRSVSPSSRRYKRGGILRFLPMDVTDESSVQSAIKKIGPVDLLVLAAGFGIAGTCEEVPVELAKKQMEVNYFGVLRVVSAVLPSMRRRKSGKIIIIGSMGGRIAIPMQSHYSSSKYALEAYSDALRLELRLYDIDVTLIEPGDIKTGFSDNRETYIPEGSPYDEMARHAIGVMDRDERNGASPELIANAVMRVSRSDHPKARVVPGIKYKAISLMLKIFPDSVREMLVRAIYLKK